MNARAAQEVLSAEPITSTQVRHHEFCKRASQLTGWHLAMTGFSQWTLQLPK
jgi:hypothetical protein